MIRSRHITFLAGAAAVPLGALALSACGGGGHSATAASAAPKSAARHTTTVRVANNGKLGKILVDSRGRTLYLFKKDSGTKSACSGACAVAWPPLRANGKLKAGSGVKASKLGTTKRSDGKPEVTYNGHPLYTFVKDTKAGETSGEGLNAFGAPWFAVSPSGKQVTGKRSSSGAGSSSSRSAAPTTPKPTTQPAAPAAPPAAPAAPKSPPAAPKSNGIPQNNGGDGDSDNNGGPSDGDGNI